MHVPNQAVNANLFFLPFLEKVLPTLINGPITLLIDGSVVGRNSACLQRYPKIKSLI